MLTEGQNLPYSQWWLQLQFIAESFAHIYCPNDTGSSKGNAYNCLLCTADKQLGHSVVQQAAWATYSHGTVGVRTCRGATTFSKLGVLFLGLGYYYPSTEKNRQVYPVWCIRLHKHTIHQKAIWTVGGSVQILGRSEPPGPTSGCAHANWNVQYCHHCL